MALKEGDIVFAYIPDPDGNPCLDDHPVMVFRAAPTATNAWVVGISSKFTPPIPAHWLRLPWDPKGHPVTGLYLESVLKCNWIDQKLVKDLSQPIGVVPVEIFELACDIIATRAEQERAKRGQS